MTDSAKPPGSFVEHPKSLRPVAERLRLKRKLASQAAESDSVSSGIGEEVIGGVVILLENGTPRGRP